MEWHESFCQTGRQRQASAASEQLPSMPWWLRPRVSVRRIIAEAAPDLAALARGTAQGSGDDPFIAAATVVDAVAKREGKARERYLGGAKAAAKARSTREKKFSAAATLTWPPRAAPASCSFARDGTKPAARRSDCISG